MSEIKRKLATIEVVKEIKPIPDADLIELVVIRGWQCVTKKGEFEAGNLCVFFEIDSFLPIEDKYEFLRKSSYKKYWDGSKEGFRLKTIRLRGQVSQGLALPVNIFDTLSNYEPGTDVTDILGIELYDPPMKAQLAGIVKGNFPSFLVKTDEERVQNLYDDFKRRHTNLGFEVSVKMDGSSMTCYLRDGQFGVCSRNLELKSEDTSNSLVSKAIELDIENKLVSLGKNIALQGEIIGSGIQGNNEKINGTDYLIFNIYDIDNRQYLLPKERQEILSILRLKSVPVLHENFKVFQETNSLEEILEMAEGKSMNENVQREGVVFKSTELVDGALVSFKAISNAYLIKQG
jgi:RNA ligase (TIGR02306 family)